MVKQINNSGGICVCTWDASKWWKAEVVTLKMSNPKCLSAGEQFNKKQRALIRLESMGIREGKTIEVIQNYGRGLVLCKIDSATYAIERNLAMKVIVKKYKEV